MNVMTMPFDVESDCENQLLVIRYSGRVEAEAVEECLLRVRAELSNFHNGFQLLADLTELESMDTACVPFLEKIMRACNEKGVSVVVRAIPDPTRDIGLQILSLFHYSADVRVVTCASLEEAMTHLAI